MRQHGNLFTFADLHLPDLQLVVEYFDHIQNSAFQRTKYKLSVIVRTEPRDRLRLRRIAAVQNGNRILHDAAVAVDDRPADCGTGFSKPSFEDVDGLITNEPGVALVTQYADCTPLIFCDPVKKVIATSHAGWRGTVKEIGKVTVQKMQSEFGCNPSDIIAAIGPCIGQCCYEVDTPVYNAFCGLGLDTNKFFIRKDEEHFMLDLREANRQILVKSGINPEKIDVADICTCCNSDKLHSHRASKGERGNLAAIIELI